MIYAFLEEELADWDRIDCRCCRCYCEGVCLITDGLGFWGFGACVVMRAHGIRFCYDRLRYKFIRLLLIHPDTGVF